MNTEANNKSGIEVLYKQAAENHRYIVEWRHKILVRHFLVAAAFFWVTKWMWETDNMKSLLFLPFLLLTIISLGFFLMDRRVTEIMYLNAETAKRLELLLHENGGYYTDLKARKASFIHFSTVLLFIYLASVVIFALFSIILFAKYTF